jgi:hypothetical protein
MTEEEMERRFFLKSLLGLAGAAVVGVVSTVEADAMPIGQPAGAEPTLTPETAMATQKDLSEAQAEKAQYYYYRRPRRRVFVRRYYYRPRRRVYFYRRRRWW